MITYEKYLYNKLSVSNYDNGLREFGKTDNCLNKCLEKLFPNNVFIHNKFIKNNGKFVINEFGQKIRPDYRCDELKLIVEFDGDSGKNGHYTDPFVILKDQINTKILENLGYKVVRIPFYVQLDKSAIKYFFNIDYNNRLYKTSCDHGFLHPLIILPSQFCETGIYRFLNDLTYIPKDILMTINESIESRIKYYEDELGIFDKSLVIPKVIQQFLY
jgi:very-short-patch-repair endonuclease